MAPEQLQQMINSRGSSQGGIDGRTDLFAAMHYGEGSDTWSANPLASAAVLATPTVVILLLKWWPHTPIGRRVLLQVPSSEDVVPDSPKRRELQSLVGKVGRARSVMLPSGAVEIEGQVIDAVSEGMPIDPGQNVEVVEVRGTRVVVRPSEEQPTRPDTPAAPGDKKDLLSEPIDDLGIDPFGDSVS